MKPRLRASLPYVPHRKLSIRHRHRHCATALYRAMHRHCAMHKDLRGDFIENQTVQIGKLCIGWTRSLQHLVQNMETISNLPVNSLATLVDELSGPISNISTLQEQLKNKASFCANDLTETCFEDSCEMGELCCTLPNCPVFDLSERVSKLAELERAEDSIVTRGSQILVRVTEFRTFLEDLEARVKRLERAVKKLKCLTVSCNSPFTSSPCSSAQPSNLVRRTSASTNSDSSSPGKDQSECSSHVRNVSHVCVSNSTKSGRSSENVCGRKLDFDSLDYSRKNDSSNSHKPDSDNSAYSCENGSANSHKQDSDCSGHSCDGEKYLGSCEEEASLPAWWADCEEESSLAWMVDQLKQLSTKAELFEYDRKKARKDLDKAEKLGVSLQADIEDEITRIANHKAAVSLVENQALSGF